MRREQNNCYLVEGSELVLNGGEFLANRMKKESFIHQWREECSWTNSCNPNPIRDSERKYINEVDIDLLGRGVGLHFLLAVLKVVQKLLQNQKEEKRETVLISGRAFKLASNLDLICDLEVDSSFSLSSSILSSIELKNEKEEVKCDTLQLLGCSCQRTIGSR